MCREFAYQDLSLNDLPSEEWKDVRGFEDMYQVSNLGRIKSLSRERIGRWDKSVTLPERILKPKLEIRINKLLASELFTLMVSLCKEGEKYYFSIGRLVYDRFVEEFNLQDKSVYIALRDHDGRNLSPANLFKSNIGELKLMSHAQGRAKSHLSILSKPITQFNGIGIPIMTYPSCYEAGKKNGIDSGAISEAARGKLNVFKGYFWRWGKHQKRLDISSIGPGQTGQINTSLQKKIGIKDVDIHSPPALLNLSLQSMQGERWKDIPGYEGLYEISNLGRIKTLPRITEGRIKAWVPEKIKQLTLVRNSDKTGNLNGYSVIATLSNREGKKKNISLSRLVYYCFVSNFDLTNPIQRVYCKDGDNLNFHYKNLVLRHASSSFKK